MTEAFNREEQLRRLLCQTADFLDRFGESSWSSKLRKAAENAKLEGHQVVSVFGGMGSFNDLLILQVNGYRVAATEEDAVNQHLNALRTQIYDLAIDVTRGRDSL